MLITHIEISSDFNNFLCLAVVAEHIPFRNWSNAWNVMDIYFLNFRSFFTSLSYIVEKNAKSGTECYFFCRIKRNNERKLLSRCTKYAKNQRLSLNFGNSSLRSSDSPKFFTLIPRFCLRIFHDAGKKSGITNPSHY